MLKRCIRVTVAAAVATALSFSLVACSNNAEAPKPDAGADSAFTGQGTQSGESLGPREGKIGETVQIRRHPLENLANYTVTEMTLGGECRYGSKYDRPVPEGVELLQVWSEADVPPDFEGGSFNPPSARVVDKEGYTTDVESYYTCEEPEGFDVSYVGVAPGEQGRYYQAYLLPEGTKQFKLEQVRYPLKGLEPNTETRSGDAPQKR